MCVEHVVVMAGSPILPLPLAGGSTPSTCGRQEISSISACLDQAGPWCAPIKSWRLGVYMGCDGAKSVADTTPGSGAMSGAVVPNLMLITVAAPLSMLSITRIVDQ
jgi:hypothetical protein